MERLKNIPRATEFEKYEINSEDKFFFDANVWIAILNMDSLDEKYAEQCQRLFHRVLVSGNKITIIPELISEIFNVIVGKKYRQFSSKYPNKKDFRSSEEGEEIIKDFSEQFNILFKNNNIIFENVELEQKELEDFLLNKSTQLDFKDFLYEKFCITNNLVLVANDSDFLNSLQKFKCVLSCHPRLIRKHKQG